jgi:ribose transport system substrate-binding protein
MRDWIKAALSFALALFAGRAAAAEGPTIAVFTKNTTNPAYQAFRLAADQVGRAAGAKIVHFVPKQPDNVDEQIAMVEQVLKDRPDAVVFIPVDDVAMVGSVKRLNDAKIPIVLASNPLPGSFVTFVGADDYAIGHREARPPIANGCAATGRRCRKRLISSSSLPASATISSPMPGA